MEEATPSVRATSVTAQVADAMAGIKKRYYGKGPIRAKSYLLDDYVFVVLEGGLTANEETLLAAGEEDLVRTYRLRFQEAVRDTAVAAVEELLDRRVLGYHSQVIFDPPTVFEIFRLERPPLRASGPQS